MEDIKRRLQTFLDNSKTPNILFYGPPGGGKKRILFEFIDKYIRLWDVKRDDYVMVVNCCINNGIKHIRENITTFAKNHISIKNGSIFKFIVLLYADKMTMDAQSAIRRCIEIYNHTTRFFIIVETKNTLMRPILSRFCEIYVPRINTIYIPPSDTSLLQSWILDLNSKRNNDASCNSLLDIMNVSKECYSNGYSLLDVLYLIEQTPSFDKILTYHQKYDILLFLNKIRFELRNELLLLSIAIYSILYIKTEPKSKKINLAFFREELSCYGNI
jgi:Cdc6-like AAA superfamily ATPase